MVAPVPIAGSGRNCSDDLVMERLRHLWGRRRRRVILGGGQQASEKRVLEEGTSRLDNEAEAAPCA